jgi:LacI family transcriptional regulator
MPAARPARSPLTIAAILNLEHAHGQGILRGIARYVSSQPEVLLLRFSHARLRDRQWLPAVGADGLIVKVTTVEEAAMLARVRQPVIDVAAECAAHALVRVTADNAAVGAMAAGYFARRGFRQTGYVGIRGHGAAELRGRGFVAAARTEGLACARFDDAFDDSCRRSRAAVARRLAAWIETLPTPAGIFCCDDLVAAELIECCRAAGRQVPADVAVLGCNNDPTETKTAAVELSSIDLNSEKIGFEAARMMVAWLREGRRPPSETLLRSAKVISRCSTDRFAVPDEAVAQALDIIHERVAGTFSVEDVARAAGVSRRLLELRFRRHLQSSIYAEVQRVRLERVAALIADPDLRLADVARLAGFSSPAKLSAAFRTQHQLSPREFRRRHCRLEE